MSGMKYDILVYNNVQTLTDEVNKRLSEGWDLVGSSYTTKSNVPGDDWTGFNQTMTKKCMDQPMIKYDRQRGVL